MMMTLQKKKKSLYLTVCHKHSIDATDPHVNLSSKHNLDAHINLEEKEEERKRISKPFHWMMNIGPLKKFLTDHYVYMNIHYHMDCARTHVHTCKLTKLPLTMRPWI